MLVLISNARTMNGKLLIFRIECNNSELPNTPAALSTYLKSDFNLTQTVAYQKNNGFQIKDKRYVCSRIQFNFT
jgi:hypothetical protein